jgi:hypothetical protein
MAKLAIIGFAFEAMAVVLLTSPDWLFRVILRPEDEELPAWMGAARARKTRVAVAAGVFAFVGGVVAVALSLSEPPSERARPVKTE